MTLSDRAARLREMVGKMTEGPFRVVEHTSAETSIYSDKEWITGLSCVSALEEINEDDSESAIAIIARMDANAHGIVALRNEAMDLIESLQAELERVRAERDQWKAGFDQLAHNAIRMVDQLSGGALRNEIRALAAVRSVKGE